MIADDAPRRADPRLRYLLPMLVVGWLVAVPVLALGAIGHSLVFLGENASAADLAATERGLQVAAATALALAVVGLVLSATVRSRLGVVLFVVLLLLSSGLAAGSAYDTHVLHRDDPPPAAARTGPPACQEHSGGGTHCPGG